MKVQETAQGSGDDRQVCSPAVGSSKPASSGQSGGVSASQFPIVGLGASAGGLGALEAFFEAMPADSGLGFVVITHQHPEVRSMMAELLGRKTPMPVKEVATPTPVEPNHVYTVRPGYNLALLGGVLQPMRAEPRPSVQLPIDYFFRSLAQDKREHAIGIVLSGMGSDGTLGLKDIKGNLGMVMVQAEQSAEYAGMPRSAVATEQVDYVLPATEMPRQLLAYVARLSTGPRIQRRAKELPEALQQIFVLIRDRTGHDFSKYKRRPIQQRIERRLNVQQLDTLPGYVEYLRAHPAEVDLLFKELLCGVTSFFRDTKAWDALAVAIAGLLAEKAGDYVLRAWVPGCATGEEAYSLAILLRESVERLDKPLRVQIFATDLDVTAIKAARRGIYPFGIAGDLTPQRLSRFFSRQADAYRVKKEIREMILFAPHNLISDPPFKELDLVSCRNLLTCLDDSLPRRVFAGFHYALKPKGVLFLGSSESLDASPELFACVDQEWNIFRREGLGAEGHVIRILSGGTGLAQRRRAGDASSMEPAFNSMLLRELVPPTVLVGERGEVVHVYGRTGLFLEPAPGAQANATIFDMARPGLEVRLPTALRRAVSTGRQVVERGIQIRANEGLVFVDLRVARIDTPEVLRGLCRISFENVRLQPEARDELGPLELPGRISELERELEETRASHQGTIDELEMANEELQGVNEQLETSKEELLSLNEELHTVNEELQGRLDELSRANNDMKNLLNATDIATIFLDNALKIKRYTEQAKRVFRLIPTDVGRSIGDLVSMLHYHRLADDAHEVLETLVLKASEVQSEEGAWYLMRILPYRTTENVIDGLVLTFVDITELKRLEDEQSRIFEALASSAVSVFGQDLDGRFTWVCRSAFGRSGPELIGRSDAELFDAPDAERLHKLKQQVLATGRAERQRLDLNGNNSRKTYDFFLEPHRNPAGQVVGFACVVLDLAHSC